MGICNNVRLSACARRCLMRLHSHHAFHPKGTVRTHRKGMSRTEPFCISGMVALPALSVGTSQPPERTDERKHLGAGVGRSVISQGTQDARINGVICPATVSGRMAVADADSSDLAQKLNAGTGQMERYAGMDNPKPTLWPCVPERKVK